VRCPYCGNENPDDHRFCGMCGRAIPAPTAEIQEPARRRDPEPSSPAPAYTGGIFNLGAPADSAHRNLDYLLDDEDAPKSHGGMIVLFLIAIAMVGGLGYLRWRNGGLPWLRTLTASTKPAPATTAPDATTPASNQPASQPSQPSTQPPPTTTPDPAATESPAPAQPNPTTSNPAPTPTTPESSPAPSANAATTPPADTTAAAPPSTNPTPAEKNPPVSAADKSPASEAPPEPAPKPKPVAKPPAPKPAPKPPDQVSLGEQYLYGRGGVPQNCERGLRYVKPAADQSNPKAMITMGALYATGHCISRDLPTAYRYFALALRLDPENGPLRQNAEMVWKQMTAEERKQAIRLTQ
jgi:zinc-ribbon domain